MRTNLKDNLCDETLFSFAFNKYSKDLHSFLYYKFGERLNPKDKVQDAFIKLWQNCAKVTPAKAKSYLYTIANNMMLNEAAHQKIVLQYNKLPSQKHTNESPEFLMEEQQYMQKLQKAISSLTEAQRVAFLMNRVEGKKHKEIAEILGISRKAVEKRIYGALDKLRRDIKEI